MYDEPTLNAGDVAHLIGEEEATIRRWHHSGSSNHFGTKRGHSVGYSVREAVGFAIARDLVNVRFPVPLAAKVARILTWRNPPEHATISGTPEELAMLAPEPGSGILQDRMQWRIPGSTRSTITVPVGRIWADVVEKAGRLRRARAG